MQRDEAFQPQLIDSGIAIRCDAADETPSIRPLIAKRKAVNPFAKKLPSANEESLSAESGSIEDDVMFKRSSILPVQRRRVPLEMAASPRKATIDTPNGSLDAPFQEKVVESGPSTERRTDKKWRLLWRGALEVGQEGYRLEGIAFVAQLSFSSSNPVPVHLLTSTPERPNLARMVTPENTSLSQVEKDRIRASPFRTPIGKDTDLCLSLESMRGRKALKVRGIEELDDDEIEEGHLDDGVKVHINPQSVALQKLVTTLLYPSDGHGFNYKGRTRAALIIGLGDDDANVSTNKTTFLLFGQTRIEGGVEHGSREMELFAARRKVRLPPGRDVVRPGDPLPRDTVLPPATARRDAFSRRSTSLFSHRGFSREPSQLNIYAPPSLGPQKNDEPKPTDKVRKTTPGWRGEKRKKSVIDESAHIDARSKKVGRVLMPSLSLPDIHPTRAGQGSSQSNGLRSKDEVSGVSKSASTSSLIGDADVESVLSPTEQKNKSTIKKRLWQMMESRGVPRSDDRFNDIFSMTNRGTAFALRHHFATAYASHEQIDRVLSRHLDMYILDDQGVSDRPNALGS